MLITALDMYRGLLELSNKQRTGSVTIPEFNRRINISQLRVIKNKYLLFVEGNQKRIDDLEPITEFSIVPNTGFAVAGQEIFSVPASVGGYNNYLFMLSVAAKIRYVDNDCFTGISDWRPVKVAKRDMRFAVTDDPYRKPKDSRLYYYLEHTSVIPTYAKLLTGTNSYGTEMRMDYLRYPRLIFIDPAGILNVNSEMPVEVNQEIVDDCLSELLENTESSRFNSNQNLKQQNAT